MAGKRQAARIFSNVRDCQAFGFTMANAKKRLGKAAEAAMTEASSPAMLAINAARATRCRSNSFTHSSASRTGSSGGIVQPSIAPAASSVKSGFWATKAEKNAWEKKWACASAMAMGPQGDSRTMDSEEFAAANLLS